MPIGQTFLLSLMQRTMRMSASVSLDLAFMKQIKNTAEALKRWHHCVEPGGAFYMFPRSLEPDSRAFLHKQWKKI